MRLADNYMDRAGAGFQNQIYNRTNKKPRSSCFFVQVCIPPALIFVQIFFAARAKDFSNNLRFLKGRCPRKEAIPVVTVFLELIIHKAQFELNPFLQ